MLSFEDFSYLNQLEQTHPIILQESFKTRKIEGQLRDDFMNRIQTMPFGSPDDFQRIIRSVFLKSCKLFLDDLNFVVSSVDFSNSGNSGWFKFRPNDDMVFFGFVFNITDAMDLMSSSKIDKKIVEKIIQTLSHELIHAVQFDRSKLKSKGDSRSFFKNSSVEKYYAAFEEIKAYAMNAVQELDAAGLDLSKILYLLRRSGDYAQDKLWDVMKKVSPAVRMYFVLFGEKRTSRKSQKIWKRFLKEFMYELEERA